MAYVYAETILLTGFVMNDLLLCAASALSEVPTVRSRRVVSAAIGSAAALTLLSCGAELWLIDTSRVLLPAGMALICTAKRGRKPFVRFLLLLWMTALLCGGASFFAAYFFGAHWRANAWVAEAPSYAAALGTAGSLLLFAHLRAYRETRRIVRRCASVRILLLGKFYECTGYFDSGPFLCDPTSGKSVVIVEAGVFGELAGEEPYCAATFLRNAQSCGLCGRVSLVPFQSVGASGLLAAVRPEKAWIGARRVEILAALYGSRLDEKGRYRALVPENLMEEGSVDEMDS